MPTCPVCDEDIDADQAAFEHHVNAHFGEPGEEEVPVVGDDDSDIEFMGQTEPRQDAAPCLVCGLEMGGMNEAARNAHVSDCLDRGAGEPDFHDDDADDDFYDEPEDNDFMHNSRKTGKTANGQWDGLAFAGRKGKNNAPAKGDKWWDPIRGDLTSDVLPPNFTPGIIPVLRDLLLRSEEQGKTRRAVLACSAVHIRGVFTFDGLWGCGYRNAEMAMAALLQAPNSPVASVFAKNGNPGVRSIQHWIDEAWRAGYDQMGRAQMGGKIVGTAKWIGPTDLYAMFSHLGIPCTLYDFRKPAAREPPGGEPAYEILLRWVKHYFDADEPDEDPTDAFDALMHPPSPVRVSSRLPLILQHAGHSRTIVGYEIGPRGDTTLLLMDPAKTAPKDVRDAGIAHVRSGRTRANRIDGATGSGVPSGDVPPPQPRTVRVQEDAEAAQPSDGDEVQQGGWVRRKVSKLKDTSALGTSLAFFRMKPRREQNEFQVLAFLGIGLLTPEEQLRRREVTSTPVDTQ